MNPIQIKKHEYVIKCLISTIRNNMEIFFKVYNYKLPIVLMHFNETFHEKELE
jgi:hypothetical protein